MADFYDEEQVSQILRHALSSRSSNPQKLSREQVEEIATELGVSREEFLAAEQKWRSQELQNTEFTKFDTYKQRKFRDGFLKYAIVNSFLLGINLFSSGSITWAVYPLMFWGLGVVLDAWATYQKDSSEYAKQFAKWQRKQQRDRLTAKLTDKVTSTVSEWLN
ncbi:hypothetical protein Syn7502_02922 [Synechococcus sp. PCC 7502]|uniref:2TM domain-containing protein n=1 Tax=Synechococcus sp. PCC 7502 TaxID=1173263 RepID=UPI00029FF1AE|nr:2TM domain-containing protein [Synechococcus sp. PCC 7502]AFY74847.1 hypothetical protein Syn7502_02922 [Synechococcus sp. PCC 7502]